MEQTLPSASSGQALPATFDFDPGFDVAFARVERTLLSATFDFDLDFHREGLGFGRAAIATKMEPAYSSALEAHRYEGLLKPETCESFGAPRRSPALGSE
jgi:predicted deacylase